MHRLTLRVGIIVGQRVGWESEAGQLLSPIVIALLAAHCFLAEKQA